MGDQVVMVEKRRESMKEIMTEIGTMTEIIETETDIGKGIEIEMTIGIGIQTGTIVIGIEKGIEIEKIEIIERERRRRSIRGRDQDPEKRVHTMLDCLYVTFKF